jgi:hypothetical protein
LAEWGTFERGQKKFTTSLCHSTSFREHEEKCTSSKTTIHSNGRFVAEEACAKARSEEMEYDCCGDAREGRASMPGAMDELFGAGRVDGTLDYGGRYEIKRVG